jgi:hypothetical protein
MMVNVGLVQQSMQDESGARGRTGQLGVCGSGVRVGGVHAVGGCRVGWAGTLVD